MTVIFPDPEKHVADGRGVDFLIDFECVHSFVWLTRSQHRVTVKARPKAGSSHSFVEWIKKFTTFAQVWFVNRIGNVLENDIWSKFKRVIAIGVKNNDEW